MGSVLTFYTHAAGFRKIFLQQVSRRHMKGRAMPTDPTCVVPVRGRSSRRLPPRAGKSRLRQGFRLRRDYDVTSRRDRQRSEVQRSENFFADGKLLCS